MWVWIGRVPCKAKGALPTEYLGVLLDDAKVGMVKGRAKTNPVEEVDLLCVCRLLCAKPLDNMLE